MRVESSWQPPEIRVNWRASLRLVGHVLKWLWVPMLLPLAVAVLDGDPLEPFLVPMALSTAVGVGFERLGREESIRHREAYLMVALSWLLVAVVGAIPFVLAGQGTLAHPVNALFESMSGVTTTGATVIEDFSLHSRSVLMWRQVLQYMGGLGILVLAIAVLSQLSVGGAQLMETETQTQDVTKLTPRIEETARLIWGLYVGFTALAVVALFAIGAAGLDPEMDLFNAVAHALTSVSTAGFSPQPESVGAFAPVTQWTLIPFMVLGATNFILLYFLVKGNASRLLRSEEFRYYVGVLVSVSALMFALLVADSDVTGGTEELLRAAIFQVVSIVTTTGYATVDFNQWSPAAKHVLFLCMFLGGMAGSTTCSVKLLRWILVVKAFRRDLFQRVHPEAVRPVRMGGRPVDEETIRDVYAYTLVVLVLFFFVTVVVVVDGARAGLDLDEFEAMGAAASTFLNIGPAFGLAGPFDSYDPFPHSTKLFMVLAMWVGRIEIIPVLVLFTPAYWRS